LYGFCDYAWIYRVVKGILTMYYATDMEKDLKVREVKAKSIPIRIVEYAIGSRK